MPSLRSLAEKTLTRKTSGRALIPEIDGLRSIAILSVVLFHASANYAYYVDHAVQDSFIDRVMVALLHTGEYGVPLFFAISGFILALPFASHHLYDERKPSLKRYFTRRLTRLEPPYIFCLIVLAAKAVIETGALSDPGKLGSIVQHLLASMFYVHTPIFGNTEPILAVAWSLEVEVQFYILAPVLCMVFTLSPVVRRMILVLATLGFSWFFGVEKPIEGPYLINQLPYFLVGLLFADLYLTKLRHEMKNGYEGMWDLAALATLLGVFVLKMLHFFPTLVTPWLIFAGYVAVFRGGLVRRFFAALPIVILGGMCYTIYLWHFVVIAGFRIVYFKVFDPSPTWPERLMYIVAASAAAIAFSAVLFVLIERPTMDPKWPQKLAAFLRLRKPEGANSDRSA
ncbi:MAG: acyltransferase [Phycisphaerales bacterium]|nr:acyltransferase [Phycisphaerales bacterium]